MKRTLIGMIWMAVLLALFTVCGSAQTAPKPEQKPAPPSPPQNEPVVVPCPRIEVRSAGRPVRDGEQVPFAATLSGGDTKVAPMYSWSISSGVMTGGQGTANIMVDSTGAGVDKAITATLLVGGFAPECVADAATTVSVAGPAKKLDEYGTIKEDAETARLNNFIPNVSESERAFVIVYAGRTSPRGQAKTDLIRIKAYLVKIGTPVDHIVTIDGGFKEEISHELWLVPIGAESPRPKPTLSAKDIIFPKAVPAKKP